MGQISASLSAIPKTFCEQPSARPYGRSFRNRDDILHVAVTTDRDESAADCFMHLFRIVRGAVALKIDLACYDLARQRRQSATPFDLVVD